MKFISWTNVELYKLDCTLLLLIEYVLSKVFSFQREKNLEKKVLRTFHLVESKNSTKKEIRPFFNWVGIIRTFYAAPSITAVKVLQHKTLWRYRSSRRLNWEKKKNVFGQKNKISETICFSEAWFGKFWGSMTFGRKPIGQRTFDLQTSDQHSYDSIIWWII